MASKKSFMEDTAIFPDLEPEKPEAPIKSTETRQISPITASKKRETHKLIQRSYYITEAQNKALQLRKAMTENMEEKDISAIVRLALEQYLKDELEQLKTKMS